MSGSYAAILFGCILLVMASCSISSHRNCLVSRIVNEPLIVRKIVETDRLLDFVGTMRITLNVTSNGHPCTLTLLIVGTSLEVRAGGGGASKEKSNAHSA